jgi:hypothetical protein
MHSEVIEKGIASGFVVPLHADDAKSVKFVDGFTRI